MLIIPQLNGTAIGILMSHWKVRYRVCVVCVRCVRVHTRTHDVCVCIWCTLACMRS